jgi:hypothetical protein
MSTTRECRWVAPRCGYRSLGGSQVCVPLFGVGAVLVPPPVSVWGGLGVQHHTTSHAHPTPTHTVPSFTVCVLCTHTHITHEHINTHEHTPTFPRWPSGQIAVMGAKGAVEIIFRGKDVEKRTLEYEQTFANPMVRAVTGGASTLGRATSWRPPPTPHAQPMHSPCTSHALPVHCSAHASLCVCCCVRLVQRAAERGFVDDVISPRETRRRLINDLDLLKTKKPVVFEKKHGNIPL